MDPVSLTIGAVTAALVAKSMDRATDATVDAGAAAVGKFVHWLRSRIDHGGQTALGMMREQPGNPIWSRAFAELIDAQAAQDPRFDAELRQQVTLAGGDVLQAGPVTQTAWGDGNTQVANSPNTTINAPRPPSQPL